MEANIDSNELFDELELLLSKLNDEYSDLPRQQRQLLPKPTPNPNVNKKVNFFNKLLEHFKDPDKLLTRFNPSNPDFSIKISPQCDSILMTESTDAVAGILLRNFLSFFEISEITPKQLTVECCTEVSSCLINFLNVAFENTDFKVDSIKSRKRKFSENDTKTEERRKNFLAHTHFSHFDQERPMSNKKTLSNSFSQLNVREKPTEEYENKDKFKPVVDPRKTNSRLFGRFNDDDMNCEQHETFHRRTPNMPMPPNIDGPKRHKSNVVPDYGTGSQLKIPESVQIRRYQEAHATALNYTGWRASTPLDTESGINKLVPDINVNTSSYNISQKVREVPKNIAPRTQLNSKSYYQVQSHSSSSSEPFEMRNDDLSRAARDQPQNEILHNYQTEYSQECASKQIESRQTAVESSTDAGNELLAFCNEIEDLKQNMDDQSLITSQSGILKLKRYLDTLKERYNEMLMDQLKNYRTPKVDQNQNSVAKDHKVLVYIGKSILTLTEKFNKISSNSVRASKKYENRFMKNSPHDGVKAETEKQCDVSEKTAGTYPSGIGKNIGCPTVTKNSSGTVFRPLQSSIFDPRKQNSILHAPELSKEKVSCSEFQNRNISHCDEKGDKVQKDFEDLFGASWDWDYGMHESTSKRNSTNSIALEDIIGTLESESTQNPTNADCRQKRENLKIDTGRQPQIPNCCKAICAARDNTMQSGKVCEPPKLSYFKDVRAPNGPRDPRIPHCQRGLQDQKEGECYKCISIAKAITDSLENPAVEGKTHVGPKEAEVPKKEQPPEPNKFPVQSDNNKRVSDKEFDCTQKVSINYKPVYDLSGTMKRHYRSFQENEQILKLSKGNTLAENEKKTAESRPTFQYEPKEQKSTTSSNDRLAKELNPDSGESTSAGNDHAKKLNKYFERTEFKGLQNSKPSKIVINLGSKNEKATPNMNYQNHLGQRHSFKPADENEINENSTQSKLQENWKQKKRGKLT